MVEEYFLARRLQIQHQLNTAWKNSSGEDISHILRGKLQAIDEMLEMKNVFKRYDDLKEAVDGAEPKGANK